MNKELIINVTASEITIALFEDKQLVELTKEQSRSGYAVGDIYMGKVKKIMPGLNAAFVNIGYEKDAFIHYLDLGPQFTSLHKLVGTLTSGKRAPLFQNIRLDKAMGKTGKISGFIASGQPILAQIAKEAISTKGPRLTSDISLAGRNVVLIPFSNKISISQKIRSNEERDSSGSPRPCCPRITASSSARPRWASRTPTSSTTSRRSYVAGKKCSTACATKRPRR